MDRKIYTNKQPSTSSQAPEPQHILQELILDEAYAAEIELLKKQKMQPRPEAVAALLEKINRKALEQQA
jgi:hypothetical protein